MKSMIQNLILTTFITLAFAGCGENPTHANSAVNETTSTESAVKTKAVAKLQRHSHPADVEMTRQIRRDLMSNKNLSTAAKNVKILTRDGQVTVKGAVASAQDRERVMDAANFRAGHENVVDEMTVK